MPRIHVKPEQTYQRLLAFWKLHLLSPDPDLAQLAMIHIALCRQETLLYPSMLDQCLAHLIERLEDARRIHMDLQLPLWAADALAKEKP